MSLKQVYADPADAVADVFEGAAVMVGGFAAPGVPQALVMALLARAPRNLTVIANGVHSGRPNVVDAGRLVEAGLVRRCVTSFPVAPRASVRSSVEDLYRAGRIQVEMVPQGTLAERIRAGGVGLGGFWVRTGVGTAFAAGKEVRRFQDGQRYVLELPLRADFALVRAKRADTLGNLVYDKTQRNFNPIMAMAADVTIAEVDEVVEPGQLDPERVVTPGIFVDRIVPVGPRA